MEQLTINNQGPGRIIEVVMLMKKVEITLSREQYLALGRIMNTFLNHYCLLLVRDKAIFYLIYKYHECIYRKNMLSLKRKFKISLDMAQAYAFYSMMQFLNVSDWPFEETIVQMFIAEIDQQTV